MTNLPHEIYLQIISSILSEGDGQSYFLNADEYAQSFLDDRQLPHYRVTPKQRDEITKYLANELAYYLEENQQRLCAQTDDALDFDTDDYYDYDC